MHEITGDRKFVLQLLKDTARNLAVAPPAPAARSAAKAAAPTSAERDRVIEQLQRAHERAALVPAAPAAKGRAKAPVAPAAAPDEDVWYAPHDRTIAIFQSAMNQYLKEKEAAAPKTRGSRKPSAKAAARLFYPPDKKAAARGKQPGKARALAGEKYDVLDPGWLTVVWQKSKLLFKGKRKFIAHKNTADFRYPLAARARIALIADWGGGNEQAQAISNQVKAANPDYVIHLGDVYYAGTDDEVKDNLLRYWPIKPAANNSFALNSNHEMYSGGYAYFDLTLKSFKQAASYFCLGNDRVRLIGLDTGYVDHDLNKEQVEWLTGLLNDGSGAINILLSHHQPFSAYESAGAGGERLQGWLKPLMDAGRITAWFWGHEHLCVVYQKHQGVKGRCIGNGCFPYDLPPANPVYAQPKVQWVNRRADPKRPKRGIHSFALLTVDGAAPVNIDYIDEDGQIGFSEKLS